MSKPDSPEEAYEMYREDAERNDYDMWDEAADSLFSYVDWPRLQKVAGQLGVFKQHSSQREVAEALAEEGVFLGGVGDNRLYIHRDGETMLLNDYIEQRAKAEA